MICGCDRRSSATATPLSFPVGGRVTTPILQGGSSTCVSDHFDSGGWATTPAKPGHAPDNVGPDVLLFHRLHYSVDSWQEFCRPV